MIEPVILLTNDDGIHAPGLALLAGAVAGLGQVRVYAPDREQSAVGHGVSLHKPLRVVEIREHWFTVDGTPTDCVVLAARSLLGRRPDLVISGVNMGANLGDDVTYSGTVAAAFEGMLQGVPSFAISNISHAPKHLDAAAAFARHLAGRLIEDGLPRDTALNVNVPDLPYEELTGARITRLGRRNYQDEIVIRRDPRGGTYYWIGGAHPTHETEPGTDFEAIEANAISITPLCRDLTYHEVLDELRDLSIGL